MIELPPHEQRHARAKRLRKGARVRVCDPTGLCLPGVLLSPSLISLHVGTTTSVTESTPTTVGAIEALPTNPTVPPELAVFVGRPRSPARVDLVVEKLCELGVHTIALMYTQRTTSNAKNITNGVSSRDKERLERLRRVATSAAKQSGRQTVPDIQLVTWAKALQSLQAQGYAIAVAHGGGMSVVGDGVRRWACETIQEQRPVAVVIGPEGGLTEKELEDLRELKAVSIGLGATRLRVETAAVVAAGALRLVMDWAMTVAEMRLDGGGDEGNGGSYSGDEKNVDEYRKGDGGI